MVAYSTKSLDNSIKDIDEKQGIIKGYIAHFDTLDSDNDIITKGAFTKTLSERGPESSRPRIKLLRNHNITEPVGSYLVLKADSTGVYYEAKTGTNFVGTDTLEMVKSGLITEHSVGFETIQEKKEKSGPRYINEVVMWEGSLLTGWGANMYTGAASLKSMYGEDYKAKLEKRLTGIEKFCRNTTATDETIEMLLMETKQLTQIIMDISTKPPMLSTLPQEFIGNIIL